MADEKEPKKEEPWWLPALGGLILLGGSVWVYFDLTQFEAERGTRKIKWFYAMLYNYLGKWGVVLFMAVGGVGAIYAGISQFTEARAKKAAPAQKRKRSPDGGGPRKRHRPE